MREISPAINLSVEEFFKSLPRAMQDRVQRIRLQKREAQRPKPSSLLLDRSLLLTPTQRLAVLDTAANLVDENLFGRSEMCMQFAELLCRSLVYVGLQARVALGEAIYYDQAHEIFRWQHAWVRVGDEVIDGNVDCLFENPMVPAAVRIAPYWGPIKEVPRDRRLREVLGSTLAPDADVSEIWWPEMQAWLDRSKWSPYGASA